MATNNIEERVITIESKMDAFIEEMREFKQEMRDFKTEMRERDKERAADIRELRQAQAAQQARHDQTMEEIRKENRNLLIAFVGVAVAILIRIFWK